MSDHVARSLLAFGLLAAGGAGAQDDASPERYNVIWRSPSQDHTGSMPLGNGEIGLNAWVEPSGDLLFYIARADSWGDNGRLLKVGRVRVHCEPPLWHEGMPFEQTLRLQDATLAVRCGEGDQAATIQLWVEANRPIVQVVAAGPTPFTATASIELWRTERQVLPGIEVSDVNLERGKPGNQHAPTVVEPDTLLPNLPKAIGWYHRNTKSVGPALTAEIQGLAGFPMPDPLLHRTFGALITAPDGERVDERRLRSPLARTHRFEIAVHTACPVTAEEWLEETQHLLTEAEAVPFQQRRAEHEAWWRDFWARSWIHVTSRGDHEDAGMVPGNRFPLYVGRDQTGHNLLRGELARASVWNRGLSEKEIQRLARDDRQVLAAGRGLVGSWVPELGGALPVGEADLTHALTLEAWLKPETLAGGGGRIFDKITPGKDDGFLLDTYPGNSLRFIVGREILLARDVLTPGQWHHVAVVVSPEDGHIRLYHNGKVVAASVFETGDDAFIVSRAYALQRFVTACAGRGHYPIKFNGSIFTVPAAGKPGDADYRRWGPGYWWQNTRLPYLSLGASGDTEMMAPLFRMYGQDLLPLLQYRTKQYFGHDGAYIPECIYFWGAVFSETYGWTPAAEREDKLQTSGWHKWEWVSGPELVWMMLDYYDHTGDEDFARHVLLPAAKALLTFFDEHYPVRNGKLVMHPAQALETWWDCTNPMPELAGLHGVAERLLALPESLLGAPDRAFYRALRAKLPALPTRTVDGVEMLAPAEVFKNKRNCENPELYAVFPFRQIALGRPRLELGIQALAHRWDRGHFGWRQDDVFMAYLGLAEEARQGLVARARKHDANSRFPAFWGPNYDWVPDQDHGGVLMKTLQAMVLQAEPVTTAGSRLFLLPAWPKEWDVSFKLHAPHGTTVQGVAEGGALRSLRVSPETRREDVVMPRTASEVPRQ
jgi:hypothetical protein